MGDIQETMRFDPDDGIANLDEHLDRLKNAADAQGFRFDRHAARLEDDLGAEGGVERLMAWAWASLTMRSSRIAVAVSSIRLRCCSWL